ncbi:MAG: type II toxin-antitoxin system Phd/YefM family antitoxin [Pseudomonadota bacterium]|nr:type II toxin-antitoxin system Phd/YefM family antitoxin [Pseudomonadota bacterium]
MSKVPIVDAKTLPAGLIHRVDGGEAVHVTRRGKPVAVLLSEAEYATLQGGLQRRSFSDAIREMRAAPDFEPVDLADEEVDSWRVKGPARDFSWHD